MKKVRGRFAPTPSGFLHLGNARTALVAWLSARSKGGELVWRTEDLDKAREKEGAQEAAVEDTLWLGLDWDEGGGRGGPDAPYLQSQRTENYNRALQVLHARDSIFPCSLSRRDINNIALAPHAGERKSTPYPVSARPEHLDKDWLQNFDSNLDKRAKAIRFKVPDISIQFVDQIIGSITSHVRKETGDFIIKRKDGIWAYQLDKYCFGMSLEPQFQNSLTFP